MKIGLISDTHDEISLVQKAISIFKENKVDFLIHAGDVTTPATLEYFITCGIKTLVVMGNNDQALRDQYKEGFTSSEMQIFSRARMSLEGKSFYISHGMPSDAVNLAAKSGEFDYVIHGHTHIQRFWRWGKTRLINPGHTILKGSRADRLRLPSLSRV